MLKRRSFLAYFSIGWLASCFPVALAACTPTSSTEESIADDKGNTKKSTPVVKTAEGFSVIGTVADLDKTGRIQTEQVVISRDPANPKKLVAINPRCTHRGCTVDWIATEKKYECPCHQASFAADGKVLKGPADQPLGTYPVKIVGTQVLAKI